MSASAEFYRQKRESSSPSVLAGDVEGLLKRLESKSFHEPNTGCILWAGATSRGGYGRMTWKYHSRGVHSLAWQAVRGPIPDGLIIRHRCDTPQCLNVEHLVLGTHRDNANDKVARGRQTRGSLVNTAKLTEQQVLSIRLRAAQGERSVDIARDFGVGERNVGNVIRRESWTHI